MSRVWFAIANATLFIYILFLHFFINCLIFHSTLQKRKHPLSYFQIVLISHFLHIIICNMRKSVIIGIFGLDSTRCNLHMSFRATEMGITQKYLLKVTVSCFMISSKETFFSHWTNSSWRIFLACKVKLDVLIVCTKFRAKAWSYCMQHFFFTWCFQLCPGLFLLLDITQRQMPYYLTSKQLVHHLSLLLSPELKATYNQLVLPKASACSPLLCQRPWCSLAEGRSYPCS